MADAPSYDYDDKDEDSKTTKPIKITEQNQEDILKMFQ